MRVASLLALGCYAVVARADEVETPASSVVQRPAFTPIDIKAPFFDQFLDDSRWKRSNAKKENTDEEWQYVGTWAVEEPTVFPGYVGDKGLVLKDKAAHHAISAKFDKPISSKGKTLVVQYEVKLQSGLECGGAYMKLLQDNKALKSDEFSNASPYIIMFGPDRCGATNKVHFIFRHKNPKTGEYEEKHMDSAPSARLSKTSTLYTLVVRPDQTFEVFIDGESARSGSLLEDFTPSVNPEKEIDDEKDSKPADWVDDAQIDDPEAVKPTDWDEDAPYEVVDEDAVKPEDWLDSEPAEIDDPEAVKPEDWDDEEDGDWVAPKISNPKCDEVSGCGEWTKPMMKNPLFKGKWLAPRIDNPLYKGFWKPRKIANPHYFEDKTPANFEPLGAIGFELWTMQDNILFDNIYIGHSVEDADKLKAIWATKNETEKAQEEAEKPETPTDPILNLEDLKFADDPVKYMTEKWNLFLKIASSDPIQAITFVPQISGALAVAAVTVIMLLVGAIGGGVAAAPSKEQIQAKAQQAKDAANKTKDQVASAVASGTEKVKDEVNKRKS